MTSLSRRARAVVGSTPTFTSLGNALTAAGDVLGLLAGYGFVVLVALMAGCRRLSAASAPTGWPAGTRWAAGTSSPWSPATSC